jgi:hypothetical protein
MNLAELTIDADRKHKDMLLHAEACEALEDTPHYEKAIQQLAIAAVTFAAADYRVHKELRRLGC